MRSVSSRRSLSSFTKTATLFGASALALAVSTVVQAAPFTAGDIVVDRVIGGSQAATEGGVGGLGSGSLTGGGITAAVAFDEYTPAGALVQEVLLPYNTSMVSGSNNLFTQVGGANTEGFLSLSADGNYIAAAGYKQSAFVTGVNASGGQSTAVPRVVALVDMNGNINTSTALTDVSSAQSFRSAYTTNGTDIWTNGTNGGNVTINSTSVSTNGIHYSTVGATTSTQVVSSGVGGQRALHANAANTQLQVANIGTPSGNRGVNSVGTGFPQTTGNTITELPGFSTTSDQTDDFWFANATTLYTSDIRTDTNGGVRKYIEVDTNADSIPDTWQFQYNITLGASTVTGNVGGYGLAGALDGNGNALLYVTTFDGGGANTNKLDVITDSLAGTTATDKANAVASLTTLQISATNSAFRGVVVIPTVSPEPGSLALLALGGVGMLRRRKA